MDLGDIFEMTEAEQKQLDAILEKFLSEAGEYCDSVRVFISRWDGNQSDTTSRTEGRGNLFAQQAQCREWLVMQDELMRQNTVSRDDEDGEKTD